MLSLKSSIDNNVYWLRSLLFLVVVLMAVIIVIDEFTMPVKSFPYFNSIRIGGQIGPILVAFLVTFLPNYQRYYQHVLLVIAVTFSLVTVYIIWAAWNHSNYAFAYEGLMINVFFFFIIARMALVPAVIYVTIILTAFLWILIQHPIYGDRNIFNFVMLTTSHIIALVGVYRLQKVALENQTYNQLLINYSITDELTQIYNRKGYHTLAPDLFQRCVNQQLPFTLYLFDIDYFKEFNDQHGHAKGDEVLKLQANILQQFFSPNDAIISRFGGDEFLVIASTNEHQSYEILVAIIKQWQTQPLTININSEPKPLSCSVGSCTAVPSKQDTLGDFFLVADKALYQAKKNGRGNYVQSALN